MDLDQLARAIQLDELGIAARLELGARGQLVDGAEYSAYCTLTW